MIGILNDFRETESGLSVGGFFKYEVRRTKDEGQSMRYEV